jgi:hypothetical protein
MSKQIPILVAVVLLTAAACFFAMQQHWFDGLHEALHPDPARIERHAYELQAQRDRDAALARGDAKEAARQEELSKQYAEPKN